MKLHPRACLVCQASFKPEESEQWWCSEECRDQLEITAALNVEADRQVEEMN